MRQITGLIGVGLLTGALGTDTALAADTSGCQDGERVIRFSHVTAETGHPKGRAAKALAERVNAEFDGTLCMIIYPNAELYSDNEELFAAMQAGEVQMAAPSLAKMSGFSKGFQVFDLPFMFRDMIHVIDFTYTDEAQGLLRSMDGTGLTGLAYWMNGMRQISANRALEAPGDVAGLRFRIQGSPVERAYYGLLGADVQKMSFSKVFGALESGEVDGQENSWSNIYTKAFHTVQHSINETNHSLIAYALIVSTDFWQGLPRRQRDQLNLVIQEVTHEYNGFAFQLDEVNRSKVFESDTPVRVLDADARQLWVNTLRPVWQQFEGEIGAGLIAAASGGAVVNQ
ncbi:MAG: DctP family TRAP transporter solute-binding subunit [Pseudomonadota bacterium]